MYKRCLECGEIFHKKRFRSKKSFLETAVYCSKECQSEAFKTFYKGRKITWGEKITQAKLGHSVSLETRKKISKAQTGIDPIHITNNGTDKSRSFIVDWTRTLRISIRERDHYTCQLCKEKQGDEALSVHHIDYDKRNCNSDNLISLCRTCHTKTNTNRSEWQRYLTLR